MKQILLTQGRYALVDDDIYDYLMQWKWQAKKNNSGKGIYYAARYQRKGEYEVKRKLISMHRAVLEFYGICIPEGMEIDHINDNGLDNQIDNLRVVTVQQNQFNKRPQVNNLYSQFKGVTWCKRRGNWRAFMRINGKKKSLGSFDTELEAALAYDEAAKKYHGEFARLNVRSPGG